MGSAKKQSKSFRTRATRSTGRANLLTSDPLQNTAQLNNQLRSLGLYPVPTLGDGNCLFRALSDQYYGSPSRHAEVRRDICDFIEAHPERYEGFVDIDEFGDSGVRKGKGGGLSAYVAGMRQNATYGGHMELSAFAHLTKRNIKVIQPGLVYVIQWDPQQPKSPKVKLKNPPDSPSKHTRLGSKKFLDGDGDAPMSPQEEHEEEGGPTIYVAYHDWEHFSSVRNLRGPHSGIPNVHETPPPPTAESSTSPGSSASPAPEEHLSPAKARKKERERKEKEKKEAGRLKAKEKAATNPSSSSAHPKDKPKSKIKDEQKGIPEAKDSSSAKAPSSGFKLKIPARPSMITPTLSMTAPTPISAGVSPLSSLSPSPAPSHNAAGDVDAAAAVPLPASVPPSVATSPPVSHSPSPAPGVGAQVLTLTGTNASNAPMASPGVAHTSNELASTPAATAPNPYSTYPYTYPPYGPLQYPPYPYNYTAYPPYAYPVHPSHFPQGTSASANGVYAYPSSMSQPPGQASTSTSSLGYYHPPQHPLSNPGLATYAPDPSSQPSPYASLTSANSTVVAIDPLSRLTHLTHLNPPPRSQRSPKRSFEESINEEGSVESGISVSSGESKRSRMDDTPETATPQMRGRLGHRSLNVEESPEDIDEDADAEGDPDPDVLPVLSNGSDEPQDAENDAEGDVDEDAIEEHEVEEDLSGSPPRTTPGLSPDTSGSSSSVSESLEELDEADEYGDDDVDEEDDEYEDEDEEDEDEDGLEPNLNHTRPVSANATAKSTTKSRRAVGSASALAERPLTRRERKKLGLPKPRPAAGKITIPAGRTTRSAARRGADVTGEWNTNGSGRVDVRGFRELKI